MNKFCIVHFTDEDKVEAVPAIWLNKEKTFCTWPNYPTWSAKFRQAFELEESPKRDWAEYPVRVMQYYGKLFF